MGTSDVRVDSKLNKFVWHRGVRNIPRRVRVRLSRKRNEDEDAAEPVRCAPVPRPTARSAAATCAPRRALAPHRPAAARQLFTLVQLVEVPSFKGLQTEVVAE